MPSCPSKPPSTFSQVFPPAPSLTEKNLYSLAGKVVLITGATSGIGLELANIVYGAGANVHITGRDSVKIEEALKTIRGIRNTEKGATVKGWTLDLADLSSIKGSAEKFLEGVERLDVLVHNAGVMKPPKGSKTKHNHDLEMGTNCLGPYLLNHFLSPLLLKTASFAPESSVRIVWLSSMVAVATVKNGIHWDEEKDAPKMLNNVMENYMQSKVGNTFLAAEMARELGPGGVVCVSVHPGFLSTELNRHAPGLQQKIMGALLKPAIFGAYTELWAAFSPEVKKERNGAFIVPWGRFGKLPDDIEKGLKTEEEGGSGLARRFTAWCERETRVYM
ncbi:NAD(P)-binding protein [Delitschia confertaspora ATCC 74209]|uniref:NAD(P)-binding protein n=1 Tax=Delitschia confertaspora ATCC 74209 TaxID=1513339 RepID=A0A9P4JTT9_9PLEO|nr:NAD(P)-binding protein [Delitschia confertaspora ATCC 74209]